MHAISLPHVFQSDPNIRDGLGENLKSLKSSPGPRDMPLHVKGWAHPQSHAWEAQAGAALWFLIPPRRIPLVPSTGRATPSAHSSSRKAFPCLQHCLWETGWRGDGEKLIPVSQCLNKPQTLFGEGRLERRSRFFFLLPTQVTEWIRGQGTGVLVLLHPLPKQGQGGWENLGKGFPPPAGRGDDCFIMLRNAPVSPGLTLT